MPHCTGCSFPAWSGSDLCLLHAFERLQASAAELEQERDHLRDTTAADEAENRQLYARVAELEAESRRLQGVIRTGGAMYRLERAIMGIPGGHDPEQHAPSASVCTPEVDDTVLFPKNGPEHDRINTIVDEPRQPTETAVPDPRDAVVAAVREAMSLANTNDFGIGWLHVVDAMRALQTGSDPR